jgi:heme/copper-type cytochrome/quinol oxidase subunit 3
MVNILFENSFAALYLLLSATYSAAALCSHRGDHKSLTRCYVASALLYALFAACHAMHLG